MTGPLTKWSDQALDEALRRGDAEADAVLVELLTKFNSDPSPEAIDNNGRLIHETFGALKGFSVNRDLDAVVPPQSSRDPRVNAALARLAARCGTLPEWADPAQIARAEALFAENGALICVLLFCSSLPEVYCAPDISAALHTTGNLERATDQRIRSTAVMILSVLMKGGLLSSTGGGRPLVLKARFGHAVVRALLLRGSPNESSDTVTPPLSLGRPPRGPFEQMLSHGWNTAEAGIPCNQEELAYTLLTFGYVYLRSLRRIGLALPAQDEAAYLHFWNVVGHVLGIESSMMAHSMEEAEFLFGRLQSRATARANVFARDARPLLGGALMNTIEQSISFAALRPMVSVITRFLTSTETARTLGLNRRLTRLSRALFFVGFITARSVEEVVRRLTPTFSITRFVVRLVGFQLIHKVLTDAQKPIELTPHLREQMDTLLAAWGYDAQAPAWLNRFEDLLTTTGSWSVAPVPAVAALPGGSPRMSSVSHGSTRVASTP